MDRCRLRTDLRRGRAVNDGSYADGQLPRGGGGGRSGSLVCMVSARIPIDSLVSGSVKKRLHRVEKQKAVTAYSEQLFDKAASTLLAGQGLTF